MTASELSARLQELIAIHGDIEVTVACSPKSEIQVVDAEYHPSASRPEDVARHDEAEIPERIMITGNSPDWAADRSGDTTLIP